MVRSGQTAPSYIIPTELLLVRITSAAGDRPEIVDLQNCSLSWIDQFSARMRGLGLVVACPSVLDGAGDDDREMVEMLNSFKARFIAFDRLYNSQIKILCGKNMEYFGLPATKCAKISLDSAHDEPKTSISATLVDSERDSASEEMNLNGAIDLLESISRIHSLEGKLTAISKLVQMIASKNSIVCSCDDLCSILMFILARSQVQDLYSECMFLVFGLRFLKDKFQFGEHEFCAVTLFGVVECILKESQVPILALETTVQFSGFLLMEGIFGIPTRLFFEIAHGTITSYSASAKKKKKNTWILSKKTMLKSNKEDEPQLKFQIEGLMVAPSIPSSQAMFTLPKTVTLNSIRLKADSRLEYELWNRAISTILLLL